MRKVANYVVQKLELELPLVSEVTKTETPGEKTDSPDGENDNPESGKEEHIPPEQYTDILCNNKVGVHCRRYIDLLTFLF